MTNLARTSSSSYSTFVASLMITVAIGTISCLVCIIIKDLIWILFTCAKPIFCVSYLIQLLQFVYILILRLMSN